MVRFAGNTSDVGGWITAGKYGAKGAADAFKVAAKHAPDYGGIAETNMDARSGEREAAENAKEYVTRAGINAIEKVKTTINNVEAGEKILDLKLGANRMAGIVGAVGTIAGGAYMGFENNAAKARQKERDAKDDARWQQRMDLMQQGIDNAPEAPQFTAYQGTAFTPPGDKPTRVTLGEDWKPDDATGNTPKDGDDPKPSENSGTVTYDGTFNSVMKIAEQKGAKYPALVAAQWQLESGGGTSPLAKGANNFFGQKTTRNDPNAYFKNTKEEVNGSMVTQNEPFKRYDSADESIGNTVSLWHNPYKDKGGANSAASITDAISYLQGEGYATDSSYGEKLKRILKEQGYL